MPPGLRSGGKMMFDDHGHDAREAVRELHRDRAALFPLDDLARERELRADHLGARELLPGDLHLLVRHTGQGRHDDGLAGGLLCGRGRGEGDGSGDEENEPKDVSHGRLLHGAPIVTPIRR